MFAEDNCGDWRKSKITFWPKLNPTVLFYSLQLCFKIRSHFKTLSHYFGQSVSVFYRWSMFIVTWQISTQVNKQRTRPSNTKQTCFHNSVKKSQSIIFNHKYSQTVSWPSCSFKYFSDLLHPDISKEFVIYCRFDPNLFLHYDLCEI